MATRDFRGLGIMACVFGLSFGAPPRRGAVLPTHWTSLLLGLRLQELPQEGEVAAAVDTEFDFSSGPHSSMRFYKLRHFKPAQ